MRTLRIAGVEPGQRAAGLSAGSARWLPGALAGYDQLFAAVGLRPARIEQLALAARDALAGWAPDLSAELDFLAEASGVPPWRIHAVNARTELLAAAGAAGRAECSTVAGVSSGTNSKSAMIGAQTWDWHRELAGFWAVLDYPQARRPFVTLTEFGLLGKIGINSAGVGVLFNILSHRSDTGDGGVPVHAVARRILDSAGNVEAGISILRSAPLAASSCFTLLDATRLACLEASPAGVAELPQARWSVHTNHFQDPELAAGALPATSDSDSLPRHEVLTARSAAGAESAEELADLLCAHESDGAGVCCHPAVDAPLGSGWQTLATVGLSPASRRMSVLAGGPCGRPEQRWRQFRAG
ncbi:MAG: C45 family peptidase [Jatrophihabitantaceae bacterium]